MSHIQFREPDANWIASYLCETLKGSSPFKLDAPPVKIKLDQNENPLDWSEAMKERVVKKLLSMPWNRYPVPYTDHVATLVADYANVAPEGVLLGPGSNYLISVVLNTFGRYRKGELVIARPTFALFESHCRYEGIPYKPWPLNEDLEYDERLLPALPRGSIVVFASPNNPVGNSLAKKRFRDLLVKHPETLFIADEAYCEYAKESYTDLVGEFSNLFLIRTFSKTMSLAGVRLGYILGAPSYIRELKKLRLPFLLNHFTVAAAEVILTDPTALQHIKDSATAANKERDRVTTHLERFTNFKVKRSDANFVLVRWPTQAAMESAYRALIEAGVIVRNVSAGPGLAGCLRITIGTSTENDRVMTTFDTMYKPGSSI